MGQDLWHHARQVAEYSQPKLLAAAKRARDILLRLDQEEHQDLIEVLGELDRAIHSAHIA